MSDRHTMRRTKRFLGKSCASTLLCLVLAACSKQQPPPKAREPLCAGCNLVLISMDTVRADHLGTYGYGRPTSPNVDALAKRAIVFENAVSQSAWTLPAHGSMLTGLYPGRLGLTHYPAKRRLSSSVPTLPEVLGEAGYTTAAFTGGGFVSPHFGFGRGFNVFSTEGRRFEHNIDDALQWLEQNKGRRFFLFFHGYDAHRPYFSRAQDKRAVGLPPRGPIEKRGFCTRGRRTRPPQRELETIVRYYDASIRMGDRIVGRLLDALAEHNLMRRTVVLITSDHGEEFFEHGNCDHVRFLYKEVVNVPFILYVPRRRGAVRVPDVVPASISVPRTLLDLVGIVNRMPGASLEPMVRGKRGLFGAAFSETDSVVGSLGSRGATTAMTGDRYKLISYTEEGTDEAYDLSADPDEQRILPEAHDAYLWRLTLRAFAASQIPLPPDRLQAKRGRPTVTVSVRPRGEEGAERRVSASKPATEDVAGRGRTTAGQPSAQASPAAPQPTAPRATSTGNGEQLAIPEEIEEQLRALGYLE